MPRSMKSWSAVRRTALAGVAVVSALVLAACGGSDSSGGGSGGDDAGLNKAGTLTVGMNLQFKPEMYLDAAGKPAGYDVDLLNKLATELGVKLNIQNLDFNGLIPGLQSKKFDMVSVGFSATEERKKVIDFTRAYVPYTSVLAVGQNDTSPATVDSYNAKGKTITALQGSTGEQLAKKSFPQAKVSSFSDQNAALLQVATGRAQGSVVEDYILAQYQKSNPNQVKKAALPQPLDLSYGAWAVQKGNSTLRTKLDAFLCKAQKDGTLAELYKKDFEVSEFPAMPEGC
ncbi:ABC transporter substrate-binding protein [Actinomadura sp. HBU206391]|uniref:ABC transporter substrate-binding protein n=1 Tax=Actinomadura sp. HBU206391 TaxID=2731692 RepID=UPI001650C914|nr:ABC transporter substrate-binding protein [Actinomadura sp. HBU206391]MBC6457882.1 amino acid ABC transporter substrate-binding protein [Actinomadura sp. HBU206391]